MDCCSGPKSHRKRFELHLKETNYKVLVSQRVIIVVLYDSTLYSLNYIWLIPYVHRSVLSDTRATCGTTVNEYFVNASLKLLLINLFQIVILCVKNRQGKPVIGLIFDDSVSLLLNNRQHIDVKTIVDLWVCLQPIIDTAAI